MHFWMVIFTLFCPFLCQAEERSPLAIPKEVLERSLKDHIIYNQNGPNTVGHIMIDDKQSGISQATFLYIKAAMDYYKEKKPTFVILELNTPGGEVFAAERIAAALKELDTQYGIPIVAYINNWAMSAGAMLAYSSRYIVVTKDASMGAAEPITMTGEKTETASEKVNSALRADFANHARFFDRNPDVAEAMVDKDIILVLRNGKFAKLNNDTEIQANDIVISPKGKLLTLNAQQLIDYGVADLMVFPAKLPPITEQEKQQGKWPADKMTLFQEPFFKNIPQATVDSYRMDWKTQFFVILAHPIVSSILFLGMLLGFYMEMNTPGFGLAGTVAITCLFFILLSSFALEAANWLELIFLLAGLAIILVELFVLPTFGLLGFIGIILFLAGLFGLMIPGIESVNFEYDTKTLNAAGEFFFERLAWLCGTLILAIIIMILFGRYFAPRFGAFRRFVLEGKEQMASEGYTSAGQDVLNMPPAGTKGIVEATLRPAGKVLIGNTLFDAISDGDFIEKGETIVVVRVEGSKIIVETIEES